MARSYRGRHDDPTFSEPPDGLITAPENHVVAHVDDAEEAAAAVDELVESGGRYAVATAVYVAGKPILRAFGNPSNRRLDFTGARRRGDTGR